MYVVLRRGLPVSMQFKLYQPDMWQNKRQLFTWLSKWVPMSPRYTFMHPEKVQPYQLRFLYCKRNSFSKQKS